MTCTNLCLDFSNHILWTANNIKSACWVRTEKSYFTHYILLASFQTQKNHLNHIKGRSKKCEIIPVESLPFILWMKFAKIPPIKWKIFSLTKSEVFEFFCEINKNHINFRNLWWKVSLYSPRPRHPLKFHNWWYLDIINIKSLKRKIFL